MNWQEYKDEKTEDLLEIIKWKDQPEYAKAAEAAFIVFCFRFRDDVVSKCEIICSKRGYDKQVAAIIAQRTFERFWKYPRYDHEKSNAKNIDDGLKFYLYGFAENEISNWRNEQLSPYNGDEEIKYSFPEYNLDGISVEKRGILKKRMDIVSKALDRLTEKHKIIYLTYEANRHPGHNLPGHLYKKLRDELGLTQNTVRYYYNEAKNKIEEYLEIYG